MHIYQQLYNFLSYRIFGIYQLSANQDLICTGASFLLTLVFVIAPIVIAIKIVRFICDL